VPIIDVIGRPPSRRERFFGPPESVKDVPPQRVTLGETRVIEVVIGAVLHPDSFHHSA
jgi:hypothetical protein